MPKHAKKKQKTAAAPVDSGAPSRLDLLLDDSTKDDEERRLESALFGVKYAPTASKGKGRVVDEDDEDVDDLNKKLAEGVDAAGGSAFAHLEDSDLFFVDDGEAVDAPMYGQDDDDDDDDDDASQKSDVDEEMNDSDDSDSEPAPAPEPTPTPFQSSKKAAAWTDADDVPTASSKAASVSLLQGPSRLRKLRVAADEDIISTREYETRLRSQYERLNPEPEWAKKAKKLAKKQPDLELLSEDEDDDDHRVFASSKRRNVRLPRDTLNIERLRDVNQSTQNSGSGEVKSLSFHPSASASILCVATSDRRVRLFNVDAHLSPLLLTLHLPALPFATPTPVLFHPSGSSLLLSGPRPFFYTYDLQAGGEPVKHTRGLWGTTFSSLTDGSSSIQRRRKRGDTGGNGGGDAEGFAMTSFNNAGDILAVAGRGGNVHLVDWKSGAGQVVGSLKCSGAAGSVGAGGIKGMWWVPPSAGKEKLAVLTGDSEVFIWDVGERRCVRRWQDEGGFRGAARCLAGSEGHLAVGSNTGYVNLYGSDAYSGDVDGKAKPELKKAIANLTTPISSVRFNHDAQVMAMASKEKKDALRMVHVPSQTVFANWPTSGTPLGHVTAIDFSPTSEHVVVGNTRGKVLLWSLKDYGVW